jgi:hypothetical protein
MLREMQKLYLYCTLSLANTEEMACSLDAAPYYLLLATILLYIT